MNISIIIVTRNRALLLHTCLTKLIPQLKTGDELIVVDNASTDNTKMVVQSFIGKLPILYIYEAQIGASYGRNSGFRKAKKQGVAFIDDDSIVSISWLQKIRLTLTTRRQKYPNTIYQGKVIQRYMHKGLYEHLRLRDFQQNLIRVGMDYKKKHFSEIRYLVAANIFSYRSVFSGFHGPFNAKMFPFIGEDPDLAYRCIQKGVRIFYAPRVSVIHTKTLAVTLSASMLGAYRYGRATALFKKLYFNNEQFLFKHYAPPVHIDKPKIINLKSIDKFEYKHPLLFIQARIFYVLMAFAFTYGQVVHSLLPLPSSKK